MKNTFYFPHDYNARNDPKIQNILMVMGHEGIALFWFLVEMLYEQEGKLSLSECPGYAWQLRTTPEKIQQLIDLAFEKDETHFFSNSVLDRIKFIKEKSQKAKDSASKRWGKDANALPTHSEPNAINKSKSNEMKVNESKEEIIAPEEQSIPEENKISEQPEDKNQLKRLVAVIEKVQDTKIVVWGKQGKALKMMLKAGYDEKQIVAAIKIMAKDPFWEDKSFDLMSVANSIANIKSRIRKGAKQNGILQQINQGGENGEIREIAASP